MRIPDPNEIMKFMKKPSYRPMRVREISKHLGVSKENRSVFKKVLRKLVREGAVERIQGGRYKLSGEERPNSPHKESKEKTVARTHKPIYKIPKDGKILGKFVRTGKTGIILPRNRKIPPLVVRLSEVKGIRSESLVVAGISGSARRSRGSNSIVTGRPQGKVIDVLGKSGNLDVERKSLLVEYDLSEEFPSATLKEAEEILPEISSGDLSGRVDLRGSLNFTIDNDTARDFDDAVGISRTHSGYKLWVSIADVSHYVKLGSAIDNEALKRGTSVYLPEKVIPMLPEKLSNWICSLVPNEDRLTKTVEIDFDKRGSMVDYKIYNSVIRNHARLTYTGVSEMLESGKRTAKRGAELIESLRIMRELYEKLREMRLQRGGLDFNVSEPELVRDELGSTIDVIKSQRNVANGIIEEFMIAANGAVAEYTFSSRNPSIYRIHEPPDVGSVKELIPILKRLGYILHIDGNLKAPEIQRIVSESKDKPEEIIVSMLILRSMKRAIYSTLIEGHFGLALDHYTHFTSPIRRYPDLIVHRVVSSLINMRKSPYDEGSLDWIAVNSSTRERLAVEVEREAVELERVYMMKSHIGKEFGGFIVSVLPFGIFVELKETFVEGFVPKEKIMKRRGRWFEVGQEVKVKVIEADLERRRLTLELAS